MNKIEQKIEHLRQAWVTKQRDVERLSVVTVPRSRRFWKDQWHPYGWEVGFDLTVKFSDGKTARMTFRDIGTRRDAAISNAMRGLDMAHSAHPDADALYRELCAFTAKIEDAKARFGRNLHSQDYREPKGSSGDKLRFKIGQLRAKTGQHSRKFCWELTNAVLAGEISYRQAVAKFE